MCCFGEYDSTACLNLVGHIATVTCTDNIIVLQRYLIPIARCAIAVCKLTYIR